VALFGNPPIQIPPAGLAGAMSVQDFANAINAQADSPVTASVVQAAPGQYRLVLTGRNSETANAFTVTSTLNGGAGLTFTDTNNNGTYGDSDAAPYSELMSFAGEQNSAAANGTSNIARDGMVRALKAELRTAMQAEYPAAGEDYSSRLSTVGVEFQQDGTIKINASRLASSLKASSTSVRTFFDAAFAELTAQVEDYAKSGGLIQGVKDRLKDQIGRVDNRLASMQLQLDLRRMALQQEFIAADLLMTQLEGQGSSLQALNGQYRLF
jgi:flagellar capping protein FliD